MTFRSRRLLDMARDESCVNCGGEEGTVVCAHANEGILGKGGSLKAHDCMTAYLGDKCHAWVDGRDGRESDPTGVWTDKVEFMRLMILKTTIRRFEAGQVRVK